MKFLSERNYRIHQEYLENLRRNFSIFEKTYNSLINQDLKGILKSSIPKYEKAAALDLKSEIIVHEIYFSSFDESGEVCESVKKKYGSEASFLYKLYDASINNDGFLVVYLNRYNEPDYYVGRSYKSIILKNEPLLALDLFEHSYFLDYGFDKKKYIQNALSSLSLSKLKNI